MSGVFKRLHSQIGGEEEGGISPVDLVDLPANLRKVMRLMLREVEIPYAELCQAVAAMPEKDRLSRGELDEALASLTRDGWLIKMGQGETVTYQVYLRRKRASTLAKSIWAALDQKIEQSRSSQEEAGQADDAEY